MTYQYQGARALVLLHEQHLSDFLETWRRFKLSGTSLPKSDDPNYASSESLLVHVLVCAGGYLVWICKMLDLPDPGIHEHARPEESTIEAEAQRYLEHVLERWRTPLAGLPEEVFHKPTYTAPWGVDYCIDAMLEHAVMHPIRHTFQLRELMLLEPSIS